MVDYAVDLSNHDWPRGPMNFGQMVKEGARLITHKCAEGNGFYKDPYWAQAWQRMKSCGALAYGPYFVLHPGSVAAQVRWFLSIMDDTARGWRDDPCCIVQLDAEKFGYMTRAPSVSECNQFYDLVLQATGKKTIGYLPQWLYGAKAGQYRGDLWSSAYVNGSGYLSRLYPGSGGSGWNAYGGKKPIIWQFTSSGTMAGQHPIDGNAIEIGVPALLERLNGTTGEDDYMSDQHTFDQRVANLGDEARKTLAEALLQSDVFRLFPGAKGKDVVWLQTVLQRLMTGQEANAAAIKVLAQAQGMDPERVYAAIEAGSKAAVAEALAHGATG